MFLYVFVVVYSETCRNPAVRSEKKNGQGPSTTGESGREDRQWRRATEVHGGIWESVFGVGNSDL